MKVAVLVSLLVCQTLAAPTPTGPFALVREAMAESYPVKAFQAVSKFILPSDEDEIIDHEDDEATHELISLSEYPVWRLHHYNKLEVVPVPSEELANSPTAQLVPTQIAAEYAPPQEVVPVYENPAEAFYGDDEEADMSRLSLLTPVLGVANEIKNAIQFVSNIPKNIISLIGFPVGDEEVEEGIPEIPEIKVPGITRGHLPKLPVKLPVLTAEHRKPPTYVVVNKLVPEKVIRKPIQAPKIVVEAPKQKEIVVSKLAIETPKVVPIDIPNKLIPDAKKKIVIKKPFVKPISLPKPIFVKKQIDSKHILVPASTIFVQEAPELPITYNNPEHVNAALTAPQVSISNSATRIPGSDIQNIPRLVQASVQALGNINSIGQVADAVESYNELGSLISRSDTGFVPSAGFASKKIDIDTIREAQKPKPEEGHIAKSEPQRSAMPEDFKASAMDPIVVLPEVIPSTTTTTETVITTTEEVVPDASQ